MSDDTLRNNWRAFIREQILQRFVVTDVPRKMKPPPRYDVPLPLEVREIIKGYYELVDQDGTIRCHTYDEDDAKMIAFLVNKNKEN